MIMILYTIMIISVVRIKMNPNVSVLLLNSPHTGFLPAAATTGDHWPPTNAADSLSPPQHVPPMDMELYIIIYYYFEVRNRDSAECRPSAECPSADCRASQPRVGCAPSAFRHAVVRPCASFSMPRALSLCH